MQTNKISRRSFIHKTTLLAAGVCGIIPLAKAGEVVPFSSGTDRPTMSIPPLACDCHMHVYDSRFPPAPSAKLRPSDAPVAAYRLLQRRLGTTRNVVVTPSTYGTDNSCTLDAIAQFGSTSRGVAVVDTSVSDAELERLHEGGIRGIRFNLAVGSVTSSAMIEPLAKRIESLGWHIQLNMPLDELERNKAMLSQLPVPIVFDHFARIPLPDGINHPGFETIRSLIRDSSAWIKLSGAYLNSKSGAPTYDDVKPLAQALIMAAPDRIIWGSDWPHPTHSDKPDDARLLDLLQVWAPEEITRTKILVENPARLYGF